LSPSRTETLILILMSIVILLMVAIAGLFVRVTQLQRQMQGAIVPREVGSEPDEGLELDARAPDFELVDVEGRTISLVDLAGQMVLLTFSSTHCPGCKEMYPRLKAFKDNQDILVVMISHGTVEENRQLVKEQGFDFTVLTWKDAIVREYQVPMTPFFYLIDEKGVIVSKGSTDSLGQWETLLEIGGR
jgi:methylamine dehydrogenase accessory protein MauD